MSLRAKVNAFRNMIDSYCPNDTQMNRIEVQAKIRATQNLPLERLLHKQLPHAPHSPNFIGPNQLQKMAIEAKKMSFPEFYCSIKTNGKWDYKQITKSKKGE